MMVKGYQKKNVYDAVQERFHYLFHEFENIYVSFSGGKDSGVLLNLLLDFKRKYYPGRRIGVFHQDFEAQYSVTTEYVTRTFKALEGNVIYTGYTADGYQNGTQQLRDVLVSLG